MTKDASEAIADALGTVARSIDCLGNGDASTPMGAIEALGKVLADQIRQISSALFDVAEGLHDIAEAIREHAKRGDAA
jgi:hypothetical protein